MQLSFTYPDGKPKALTFSYDDGVVHDRRLVEIFNRYGMKGTFNINSGIFGIPGRIPEAEIVATYAGHEIACHGRRHAMLGRVAPLAIVDDVLEDRRALEKLTGKIINGMAYAYGTYDSTVLATLNSLGIVYSRTVLATGKFTPPENFLTWHPTCHHRENLREIGEHLLTTSYALSLCYVWGHSYEFNNNDNWEIIENFCAQTAGKSDIWYATNMEIYNYLTATRRIVTSADCRIVHNPSAQSVWCVPEDRPPVEIKPQATVTIE